MIAWWAAGLAALAAFCSGFLLAAVLYERSLARSTEARLAGRKEHR